jgi:GTPase SAR1 family protein
MTAEDKRSKELEKEVEKDFQKEQNKIKLLLLGAGESGKSTLFKQMKILYGKGFGDAERASMTSVIHNNILVAMKNLCEAADTLGYEVYAAEDKEWVQGLDDDEAVTTELAARLRNLWNDEGIGFAFADRAKFQLIDSAEYYMDSLDRIAAPGYTPSVTDVLRSRVRTSGIVEEEYVIDKVDYIMYDVGGQRNERKKWIHCFDGVTAVIFVASLSEYDQVLYEDASVNRMEEAIALFDEICNSRWFANTSMILFLNKRDLFESKMKSVDLRHDGSDGVTPPRFVDYEFGTCTCAHGTGLDDCDCGAQPAAVAYVTHEFKSRNTDDDRPVYEYVTCATDTGNIRDAFGAAREIILRDNLRGSGFME